MKGWVLATGFGLPALDELDEGGKRRQQFFSVLGKVATRFNEVQYFGSYRVVSYDAWFRERDGTIERGFAIADGQVFANIGRQSAEERELGFLDLGDKSPEAAGNYIFEWMGRFDGNGTHPAGPRPVLPDEDATMHLAAAWSIDPTVLDKMELPAAVGYLGYLPVVTH